MRLPLLLALMMLLLAGVTRAEENEEGFTPSESFQTWITEQVREQLPDKYEKSKNWGHTKRVFDGWDFEQDGLKLETRRKWKEVNDGTWTRYRVTPLNPAHHFEVRVDRIEPVGGSKVRLQLAAISKLRLLGRMSQWERGLQLISVSAEADARVQVKATVDVSLKLDPTKLPPDVYLKPEVIKADVKLLDFQLRRVGKFDGPLVRSLSDDAHAMLSEEIAARRAKMVASLNKKLAKDQDKFKFSLSELMKSEWGKFAPADLASTSPAADTSPADAAKAGSK
jgi:hypothetical protein